MSPYSRRKKVEAFPWIPLEGYLDLTYRCNNDCLHCWVRIAPDSDRRSAELNVGEIGRIADEARALGCRKWIISGGEPMLRPDFDDIFERLASQSGDYLLNTNGTLITPGRARLLKRKGAVLVALYGADAQIHDAVTRRPGSFEETMRGIAYLKEAGADVIAQIVPMRANVHQLEDMKRLALSLTRRWRVGALWMYLSASGNPARNLEIEAQRLTPGEVLAIEPPDVLDADVPAVDAPCAALSEADGGDADSLLDACIRTRSSFHVDPYGRMSFCEIVRDPDLRADLRQMSLRRAWDEFIPSLVGRVRGGREYEENCGRCELRSDCGWCPSYAYLEHRRFPARIDYLCGLAEEKGRFKKARIETNRRYFDFAGLSIQVDADLPITDETFLPYLRQFEVRRPGRDLIRIRHHFHLPAFENSDLGNKVYRSGAWTIYKKDGSWIYLEGAGDAPPVRAQKVAVLNEDHTRARIYHENDFAFRRGSLSALSLLPTDQILLGRVLADRQGCFLHACGVSHAGKGLLFVGHSEAGKSTVGKMYAGRGVLLCDDRMAVRRRPDGYRIYGTWHPGELREVSPQSAPLAGVFFLEKAEETGLRKIRDKAEIVRKLTACLIKPLATADWWEKVLNLLEMIAEEAPCYELRFDRSGRLVERLEDL